MTQDFSKVDTELQAALEWLQGEYQGLRTGRATPAILDGVQVDAYGSRMPLKQVANIGIEDARTLRITPFDGGLTKDIERGITIADLGVGVSVSGSMVRVSFPELTTERRTELVKVAKAKLEDARVKVKGARNEAMTTLDTAEKEGGVGEDDIFRAKETVQEKVDALNKKLDELFKKKEEEMLQQ